MITLVFAGIWGFVTGMIGVGWFDGDLAVAATANIIPILFVSIAENFGR